MLIGQVQYAEIDLQGTASLFQNSSDASFEEVLEKEITEIVQKAKEETSKSSNLLSKKNTLKHDLKGLPTLSQLARAQEKASHEMKNTYELLAKFKEEKKSQDNDSPNMRQQVLSNANNFAGQAQFQPTQDQGRRKMSKDQMLDAWERLSPQVTEDPVKKSVRIDIPLLNDVQALILRLNPDRSVSASLLGSLEMGKLVKENQSKLDKNLRHHNLSLKEFNTYHKEVDFNSGSDSKRGKKSKQAKKPTLDLV